MIDLYLETPDGPRWPYTDQQLRQDHPALSLSAELPDPELAALRAIPYDPIMVWRVSPTVCPPATREQRWIEAMPEMVDGAPVQRWAARPATAEEIIEWDQQLQPPPDWQQFRDAIQYENGYMAAIIAVFNANPAIGVLVASRLDDFEDTGNHGRFLQSLQMALSQLPPESRQHIIAELIALSQRCHMPLAFIAALQLQPPAEGAP